MNISGKCDGIGRKDLLALADVADIKKGPANALIDRVVAVFRYLRDYSEKVGISGGRMERIQRVVLLVP